MDKAYLILLLLPVWWLVWAGWIWREDVAKKLLVSQDIGSPHLYFLFGPIGFIENIAFSSVDRFELVVPGFRVIERWIRIAGYFWFRVESVEMTARDLEEYHWDIWKMMEVRRGQMGQGQGQDAPIAGASTNPPDNPV